MQHPMWLRARPIIPGIVFKLDMQFFAYSVLLAETISFADDKVLLLLCAHVIAKIPTIKIH